jgi:pyruvate carboxylase subunit B
MVLGYFGRTPRQPDPEIVKIASEQLGKPVFDGDPLDVLEPGIPQAEKLLHENNLPVTDENIFITATCKEKGITYLKGESTVAVYYKEEEQADQKKEAAQPAPAPAVPTPASGSKEFVVTVNGQPYRVGIRTAN